MKITIQNGKLACLRRISRNQSVVLKSKGVVNMHPRNVTLKTRYDQKSTTINLRRRSLICRDSSTESITIDAQADASHVENISDISTDLIDDERLEAEAVNDDENISKSVADQIGTTNDLLTDLFAELQTSKAARDTLEKTKMAQIYDTMNGIETELDAGIKRMREEVRGVEQGMKVEVRKACTEVSEKLEREMVRLQDEKMAMKSDVEALVAGGGRHQEKILNEAVAMCNERVSLLMENFRKEIVDHQEQVEALIEDISSRMTESDISTRNDIMKLLSSRLEYIDAQLLNEATERSEEDKAVTAHISSILLSMRQELAGELTVARDEIDENLDSLKKDLAMTIDSHKKEAAVEFETAETWMKSTLDDFKNHIDSEKENRINDEARLLRTLDEDISSVSDRVVNEAAQREDQLSRLANSIDGYQEEQKKQFQVIDQRITDMENGLRQRIDEERRERLHEDRKIISAMNEYTKALQDALRSISSGI